MLMLLYAYVLIGTYDPAEGMLFVTALVLAILAHAAVLGLPTFVALRRLGWLKERRVAAAGLVAGVLPVAVLIWPYPLGGRYAYSSSGAWHGRQVDFVADGLPTVFGWLRYLEAVAIFGLLGAASALALWFAWVYCRRTAAFPFLPATEKQRTDSTIRR